MATPQGLHQPFFALQHITQVNYGPQDQQLSKKRARDEDEEAKKTQARLERNRQHAKRARERKKEEMARLQQQHEELRKENEQLKRLISESIPHQQGKAILGECSKLHQTDYQLMESLAASKQSFVMTDPRLPDNPIVYASDKFCKLTGYSREQTVGRNCRFLQGPQTDPRAVQVVRNAINNGTDCTTVMLNYKADGTPFWNRFFVAALRDWDGNITNYVGVQCEHEGPDTECVKNIPPKPVIPLEPAPCLEAMRNQRKMEIDDDEASTLELVDWSFLAEVLEEDYREDLSIEDDQMISQVISEPLIPPGTLVTITQPSDFGVSSHSQEDFDAAAYIELFASSPLEVTRRTVRSDLIDSLMASHGDVSDPRFLSALAVSSSIYESSGQNASSTELHNGTWRSISRPHYKGCLGRNHDGEFMYTLGTMSFDMYKPGHLQCSVQRTLSHIETVCKMDGAPSAAPWSLRRELAAWDQTDNDGELDDATAATQRQQEELSAALKSYDIAVALTVESDEIPSDPSNGETARRVRLRALNVTKGYMLPDPDVANRLTVWFTGGKLCPAPLQGANKAESGYGGLEDWKLVFGGKHRRSWGESFRVMGAKLLLGAELPDQMEADGTMKYMLHRPVGGHGRTFVDVLYLDSDLFIIKSSSGIIHAMVRNSVVESKPAAIPSAEVS